MQSKPAKMTSDPRELTELNPGRAGQRGAIKPRCIVVLAARFVAAAWSSGYFPPANICPFTWLSEIDRRCPLWPHHWGPENHKCHRKCNGRVRPVRADRQIPLSGDWRKASRWCFQGTWGKCKLHELHTSLPSSFRVTSICLQIKLMPHSHMILFKI